MSTNPVTEHNFPGILPEVQAPDAEAQKRSQALVKVEHFIANIATIDGGKAVLKVTVKTADEYHKAGELLLAVKSYRKDLDSVWRPEIDRRFKAHREATTEFNRGDKPAQMVESALSMAMQQFQRDAEEARRREEARLQEEARRKAEEEARRLAEESHIQTAIDAEQSGDPYLAEQIMSEPVQAPAVYVPPVVLQSNVPAVAGLSMRTTWKGRIKGTPGTPEHQNNFLLLVRAVAEGKAPLSLLKVDETALSQLAKAMKSQFNIPGCESFPATGIAGRV